MDSRSGHPGHLDLLQVDILRDHRDVVLSLAGELDLASADHLREAFSRALRLSPRRILLDLTELEFMDASGLHVIFEAARRLGDRLRVCPGSHRQLFRLAGPEGELRLVASVPASPSHRAALHNIGYMRAVHSVWQAEGLGAMAELVPDDVIWQPSASGGRTLRGTDELLEFWARTEAPSVGTPAWFTAVGDDVIMESEYVVGRETVERVYSLFEFQDRRLIKATSIAGVRGRTR